MIRYDSSPLGSLRIAVLAGGTSAERAVSLNSGQAVGRALTQRGHQAVAIDPAETDLARVAWSEFDAAFLALHGTFGEDGQVQELLDGAGIPYTGSDAAVSRLAFSKSASKERFLQYGVPTPPYVLIHESDDAARIHQQARKLGYPLVVKPDAQGSSLGVSIVETPEALPQALARCFHLEPFGVLEPFVAGTEWTVGVLDDETFPVIQIETARPFYDYKAKYEDAGTRYLFDPPFPPDVLLTIEFTGRQAAQALGTRGLARVDLRLDRYHQPWVLEVNTIPGLTDHSLIPKAAARQGLAFPALCEQAVRSCLVVGRISNPSE